MSANVFDHPWLSGLFQAPQIAPLWRAEAQVEHLRVYEKSWTEALFQSGHIPAADAQAALAAITGWQADIDGLKDGLAQDGVVVPALIKQLRSQLNGTDPKAIHTGTTSQDVIDTALVLTLKQVSAALVADLQQIAAALQDLCDRFGDEPLTGRTRMQLALPISAGHRLKVWASPLAGLIAESDNHRLPLQIGGAVGDCQDLGDDADAILAHMAAALDLPLPPLSWHANRTGLVEYAGWLSRITGSLGKIGQDIALMAQQGVGEVSLTGGGSSSAMPHKQNPIGAELLVTLARFNAAQNGLMGQTLIHEQERSGSAWALEWMVLPQMTMVTGCAATTALRLLNDIQNIGTARRK